MRKKCNIVVQKHIDDLAETQKNTNLNDLDEESETAREEVDGIYTTIMQIRLKSKMIVKRRKTNTSRCMKKMRTTSHTKTKKMKMKMETKFIA
jgi:hypothetical protein